MRGAETHTQTNKTKKRQNSKTHQHTVTADLRVDHLGDDPGVGEADDEPVPVGLVLVLVHGHQPLAGAVVRLAL